MVLQVFSTRATLWRFCFFSAGLTALTCGLHAGEVQTADRSVGQADNTVIIVAGGDLGFGGSDQPIGARGGYRHGRMTPWSEVGKAIAPLLDGDINFANLETIVTDLPGLTPVDKKFRFRMHAAGASHIVDMGFNVLSTANNHSRDYGQAGMRETLRHLSALKAEGLHAFPGIGRGRRAALQPALITVGGHRKVAIAAIGIGGTPLSKSSTGYGQLGYHSRKDFSDALAALAATNAGYRILSAHYGIELRVRPSNYDIQRLRDRAVREAGIDLVLGHHTHVPAGVQTIDGKLIFYGLGNLLHFGMQNMGRYNACRDFGVLARIFLTPHSSGQLKARAVQVIPLTDMHHAAAKPMAFAQASKRIAVLNGLATHLNDKKTGAQGLQFMPQPDGTGLYCFDGATEVSGKIARLCRNWPAGNADVVQARFPVHSCPSFRPSVQTVARAKARRKPKPRKTATQSKSQFVADYYVRLNEER